MYLAPTSSKNTLQWKCIHGEHCTGAYIMSPNIRYMIKINDCAVVHNTYAGKCLFLLFRLICGFIGTQGQALGLTKDWLLSLPYKVAFVLSEICISQRFQGLIILLKWGEHCTKGPQVILFHSEIIKSKSLVSCSNLVRNTGMVACQMELTRSNLSACEDGSVSSEEKINW